MKKKIFYITIPAMIFSSTVFLSCQSDNAEVLSPQEEALALLTGSWTATNGSIALDGEDVSLNYPGFSVSFTEGNFQTINAGTMLPASGTWRWMDETTIRSILIDEIQAINILELNEDRLQFSFTLGGTGGVRAGLEGSYVISVEK